MKPPEEPSDGTPQASRKEGIREIKVKSFKGASAMVVRQVLIMAVNFSSGIVLARKLSPADFGIYAVSLFVLSTLSIFADIGLGAALIQGREEPCLRQYRTVFTFQLAVVTGLVCAIALLAPVLAGVYHLEVGVVWFLRVVSLTLLIGSLNAVSVIKLERRLEYTAFAKIDVAAAVADRMVVIPCALLGYGYWSFLAGTLSGAIVRAGATYRAAPWDVGFALDKTFLKSALGFGGMFQLAGMTALFRDNVPALLVGPVFGPKAVGYLNWAHNTAFQASQVFTQIVSRISFPSLAKMQDDRSELSDVINRTLRLVNTITMPLLLIMIVLSHDIVMVVYTAKWLDAIPAFWCYAITMIGGNVTTTLSSLLLATARAKLNLKIMSVWTLLVWALALSLIRPFGYNGVALAIALSICVASVWLVVAAKRVVTIDIAAIFVRPVAAALCGSLAVYWARSVIECGVLGLILIGAGGVATSLSMNWLMDRGLRRDIQVMMSLVGKRSMVRR